MKWVCHIFGHIPLNEFSKDSSKKDGKSLYCRNCHQKMTRKRRMENREAFLLSHRKSNAKRLDKQRDYILKHRYGITSVDYAAILAKQNNCCGICKKGYTKSKEFMVDHNHKTGNVRGILCSTCNLALGAFKDSPEIIEAAKLYVSNDGTR